MLVGMHTEELPPLPDDWTRALVVVAHPDDIEYGTAAAVAAWTKAGKDVSYLLVTRGEAGIDGMDPATAAGVREEEQRRAAAAVGVHDVRFLDRRDGVLVADLGLRRDLAREIRRLRPELVVAQNHHGTWAPGAWNSADHRVVGQSTIDAVAAAGNRWIFPELAEEGFEPWAAGRIAVAGSPTPTHAVDVTDHREAAVASLSEHRAYLAALDPRPVLEQAREVVHHTTGGDGPARMLFEVG